MLALAFTAKANIGGFSVTPVFPEGQNPQTQGFFDVTVVPGQIQEIGVNVSNPGDEDILVDISLLTSGTNRNGIVDYTAPGIPDETMANPFSEIASLGIDGDAVLVPAGQSVHVPIFIDIPAEGFDGVILGSIHVLLSITDEERAAGGMIINRFANILVVMLRDRDTVINPDFMLGDVGARVVNHRASIVAEVRNIQPRLTMGVTAHAQIYPAGGNEPIFARSNVNVDFAPNAIFNFSMMDEMGFGLQPGNYLARILLEHDGTSWDFEREFEILQAEAANVNAAAVNQQQMPTGGAGPGGMAPWMMAAIAGGVLVVAGAGVAFMLKSKVAVATANSAGAAANADFQMRMEARMKELEAAKQQDISSKITDPTDKEKTMDQLKNMDKEELMRLMQQLQDKK